VRSLAFGGAFFAWPYHAGVAAYIQAKRILSAGSRIYGTSSGAAVATMLACGMDVATQGLELGLRADRDGLGEARTPFLRPRRFLAPHVEEMQRALPVDAARRADGRLFLTIRRLPLLRQIAISQFPTRESILDVLAAAIAVPGLTVLFAHRSPRFGACVDGGPGVPNDTRPGATTIRIGVFQRRDYDIRPSKPFTFDQIFGVPSEARRRAMFTLGYEDAARHLDAAA
jgi:hypothetical protein